MSHRRTNPKVFTHAQELRRHPTEAEAKLWTCLRAHRLKNVGFRRQHAIGPYIVDFCAPRAKLVIELDGSQHLDQREYDAERSAYLETKGYRTIRFWNSMVLNELERVLQIINDEIG